MGDIVTTDTLLLQDKFFLIFSQLRFSPFLFSRQFILSYERAVPVRSVSASAKEWQAKEK